MYHVPGALFSRYIERTEALQECYRATITSITSIDSAEALFTSIASSRLPCSSRVSSALILLSEVRRALLVAYLTFVLSYRMV